MSNLAKNIRYLRKNASMSQNDLAELLNKKSYTTIQKWESSVAEPSFSDAVRMSEIFHVSLDDLANKNIELEQGTNRYTLSQSTTVSVSLDSELLKSMLSHYVDTLSDEDINRLIKVQ